MGIGTSLGAFYDDSFHHAAAQWDPSYDDNEIGPDEAITPNPAKVTAVSDQYDTPLSTDQQTDYNSKFSPEDSKDYDMQGFYKANPDVEPHTDGTHYPDTYKKPNHPTFSDESIYNGKDGNQGGHWDTLNGEDVFTPGPTNVKTHGLDGLIDYFDKVEPNVRLLMPKK